MLFTAILDLIVSLAIYFMSTLGIILLRVQLVFKWLLIVSFLVNAFSIFCKYNRFYWMCYFSIFLDWVVLIITHKKVAGSF